MTSLRQMLLLTAFCCLAATTHAQQILYVDDDAPLGGDGITWSTSFRYLQDAMVAVSPGDEIHVAGGVYKPDLDEAGNVTPEDRLASFQLVNGVALYGGYAGYGALDPEERDIYAYETILSGDLAGNDDDGPDFMYYYENSDHVVAASNVDVATLLDGFTITGGYTGWHQGGGGIRCIEHANPTIRNCIVMRNFASDNGGGVTCVQQSNPTIVNCTITGNTADYFGGGIHCYQSTPTITGCTITKNIADYGAAIFLGSESSTIITSCTIVGNSAGSSSSGSVYCFDSSPTITNCILWHNTPGQVGPDDLCDLTMTYCNIEGGWPDTGNINEDPLFVDPDNGDYHLSADSPCINRGDNDAPALPDEDFEGEPRLQWCRVDLGADESPYYFDCNYNGHPDACDIADGTSDDCQPNGVPDECDLAGATSQDDNENGTPDECDAAVFVCTETGNDTWDGFCEQWDGGNCGPKQTIQAGLDAAQAGDVVLVAVGVYTGDGNRDLDFQGKAIVLRSKRGPDTCYIDCERQGRGFYFHSGETGASVVDGFTIRRGYTDDGETPGGSAGGGGGGVYCLDSSPTITNCTIRDCKVEARGILPEGFTDASAYGGGISCENSSPTITNCTITGNIAEGEPYTPHGIAAYGGGICCRAGSNPTISNCTIADNEAVAHSGSGHGGGIYCDASSPTIVNCTITENRVYESGYEGYGGGVCCAAGSAPTITGCTITDNVARGHHASYGGGVCCYQSDPTISACSIMGNVAGQRYEPGCGGGIYCYESMLTLSHCDIAENEARYGGGICCDWYSHPTIMRCTIMANTGRFGGGVCCQWHSDATIVACTITDNDGSGVCCRVSSSPMITSCLIVGNQDGYGAGVYAHFFSRPKITNCTIVGNDSDSGVYSSYEAKPELTNCILWGNLSCEITVRNIAGYHSALTVSYCDVQGGQSAAEVEEDCTLNWSDTNFDADPLFADPDGGDYHLTDGSPCVDAGDPNFAPLPGETDIDGEFRVWGGGVVDVGADEFGSYFYADLNCDGALNALDIDAFMLALLDPGGYVAAYPDCHYMLADVDGDGEISPADIDAFVELLVGD